MSTEPKIYAEYGDGIVHETRWSAKHDRSIANCGAHYGSPTRCYLAHQIPADAERCGYCENGLPSPFRAQPGMGRVRNDLIARAFEESKLTVGKLAEKAGYLTARKEGHRIVGMKPDPARVRYLLGYIPKGRSIRTGVPIYVRSIEREDAIRLADALGLDPEEAGL